MTDQCADIVERLPAGLDLDRLATETKAIQRKREVVDDTSMLRLAPACGPGWWSRCRTSARASMLGITELSNSGVKYHLNQAADFLAALVERLLAAKAPGADLGWPGRILRLAEGICVSKPGSQGTDWRIHGVFDLGRGGFSHFELTDQHGAEALERGALLLDEIRIGNRNYARVPALHHVLSQSSDKADFIVRVGWNTLNLIMAKGKPFDLIDYLQGLPAGMKLHQVKLGAAVGRDKPAMALRLVV